jgi:hypothetical protein
LAREARWGGHKLEQWKRAELERTPYALLDGVSRRTRRAAQHHQCKKQRTGGYRFTNERVPEVIRNVKTFEILRASALEAIRFDWAVPILHSAAAA